jgi:hypothetical protein
MTLHVGLGEYGGVGGVALGMAVDVAQHRQQDLDGFEIALRRELTS